VPPEDKEGYKRVRNALKIPIAGGECEYTRYGFRDLIINGCVDIIQPDLCVSGGFSEFLKIHALSSSFNLLLIPHVWGSGVALASALHALACLPPLPHTTNPTLLQNEPVIEFDQSPNPLRDDLLKDRKITGSSQTRPWNRDKRGYIKKIFKIEIFNFMMRVNKLTRIER